MKKHSADKAGVPSLVGFALGDGVPDMEGVSDTLYLVLAGRPRSEALVVATTAVSAALAFFKGKYPTSECAVWAEIATAATTTAGPRPMSVSEGGANNLMTAIEGLLELRAQPGPVNSGLAVRVIVGSILSVKLTSWSLHYPDMFSEYVGDMYPYSRPLKERVLTHHAWAMPMVRADVCWMIIAVSSVLSALDAVQITV